MIHLFLEENYLWLKSLHIISVIAWMAGIFYLPRLFVYHTQIDLEDKNYDLFCQMEYRLLRIIMNPAMIATYIFGIGMIVTFDYSVWTQSWIYTKIVGILGITVFHHILAYHRKKFLLHENKKTSKYYRIINEIPIIFLCIVVFSVVFKFE